jgi:hypothetical protein
VAQPLQGGLDQLLVLVGEPAEQDGRAVPVRRDEAAFGGAPVVVGGEFDAKVASRPGALGAQPGGELIL